MQLFVYNIAQFTHKHPCEFTSGCGYRSSETIIMKAASVLFVKILAHARCPVCAIDQKTKGLTINSVAAKSSRTQQGFN